MKQQGKVYTVSQAVEKARSYCAYQERCHQELRAKLYEWELRTHEVEQVIAAMIEEGFLNEERFAKAFAGGKFRVKHWGRNKIKAELKARKISDYCIKASMAEIDEEVYERVMIKELKKKMKQLRDRNQLVKNMKVSRYLMARGFEAEMVWEYLRKNYT